MKLASFSTQILAVPEDDPLAGAIETPGAIWNELTHWHPSRLRGRCCCASTPYALRCLALSTHVIESATHCTSL